MERLLSRALTRPIQLCFFRRVVTPQVIHLRKLKRNPSCMDEDDSQLHDAAMAAVLTAAALLTGVVALMAAVLVTGCAVAIEVDAHAPDRPAVTAPRPDGSTTLDGDSK